MYLSYNIFIFCSNKKLISLSFLSIYLFLQYALYNVHVIFLTVEIRNGQTAPITLFLETRLRQMLEDTNPDYSYILQLVIIKSCGS